jgi:hypothetical protein
MACSWMDVGLIKPALVRSRKRDSDTPRVLKVDVAVCTNYPFSLIALNGIREPRGDRIRKESALAWT